MISVDDCPAPQRCPRGTFLHHRMHFPMIQKTGHNLTYLLGYGLRNSIVFYFPSGKTTVHYYTQNICFVKRFIRSPQADHLP